VHPAPLVTVELPPGFEGTWVRAVSLSHSTTSNAPPPPAPDTLTLGATASYRQDSVVPDLTDSAVQAMLAAPGGSELANKFDLENRASPRVVLANTSVSIHGDTVVVESTVSVMDSTSYSETRLIGRSTTREYLSADRTQLIAETTTEDAATRYHVPTPDQPKTVVVYKRVQ
jgi:hypothetical protein